MTKPKSFRVDARALLTLGRESIKDHSTAIIELVKNSYDAEATVVELDIDPTADSRGRIRVADNGTGMNEAEIDENWLRIGFSGKLRETRTRSGRRKTGEKGVGRLSADRLATELELRTQRKSDPPAGLRVDWTAFERAGTDLEDVPLEPLEDLKFRVPEPSRYDEESAAFGEPPKARWSSKTRSGTELILTGLRDAWTKTDVTALQRALSVLVPPFEPSLDFQIRLSTSVSGVEVGVIQSPFLGRGEVDAGFSIDSDGTVRCAMRVANARGKLSKPRNIQIPWAQFVHQLDRHGDFETPTFGPAEVRLLFFPRRGGERLLGTELKQRDFSSFLDFHAGVKVYRDNIRVMPYGDADSSEGDWLALGDRKARNPAGAGRPDYRVSPYQLVGAVYVTRDKNPKIADTSGREGLIHGNEFAQLRAFALGCIFRLESAYHQAFVAREKATDDEPPRAREIVREMRNELAHLTVALRDIEPEVHRSVVPRVVEARHVIEQASRRIRRGTHSLDELEKQATVYRGIATLGVAAATFGHETLGSIEAVTVSVGTARLLLNRSGSEVDVDSIDQELCKALKQTERISAWGRFTLGRLRRDKRRRRKTAVEQLVGELVDELALPFDGSSIHLRKSLSPVTARVLPMDIESIIVNLLTNAYYFVKTHHQRRAVRVTLRSAKNAGRPGFRITVSDSGPGVGEDHRSIVWEQGFTTKVDARKRAFGTGLGLWLVDSIVQDLRGARTVDDDPHLGGARFQVWLPT